MDTWPPCLSLREGFVLMHGHVECQSHCMWRWKVFSLVSLFVKLNIGKYTKKMCLFWNPVMSQIKWVIGRDLAHDNHCPNEFKWSWCVLVICVETIIPNTVWGSQESNVWNSILYTIWELKSSWWSVVSASLRTTVFISTIHFASQAILW